MLDEKNRGVFLLREPKRRRQVRHSRKRLGGALKSLKNDNIHRIHTPKLQGCVFLREPNRRRQLRHSRKGLGGPEIGKNVDLGYIISRKTVNATCNSGFSETPKYYKKIEMLKYA